MCSRCTLSIFGFQCFDFCCKSVMEQSFSGLYLVSSDWCGDLKCWCGWGGYFTWSIPSKAHWQMIFGTSRFSKIRCCQRSSICFYERLRHELCVCAALSATICWLITCSKWLQFFGCYYLVLCYWPFAIAVKESSILVCRDGFSFCGFNLWLLKGYECFLKKFFDGSFPRTTAMWFDMNIAFVWELGTRTKHSCNNKVPTVPYALRIRYSSLRIFCSTVAISE